MQLQVRPIFLWALSTVALGGLLTLSWELREVDLCLCPDTIRVEVPVTPEHLIEAFQLECRWIPQRDTTSRMN